MGQAELVRTKSGLYSPIQKRIIRASSLEPKANVISTSSILQANANARQWLAGLMQGIWNGGNNWLCLEVGTGTNTTQNPPDTLGNPIMRKLIDSIQFTLSDGTTASQGPTTTLSMQASLQTPDANGQTISEWGIYGGAQNLNQSPFGSGILLLYQSITPISKTSSMVITFATTINT